MKCPVYSGTPLLWHTLHQVPKVSTIEEFHCIQDTSPGPQGWIIGTLESRTQLPSLGVAVFDELQIACC